MESVATPVLVSAGVDFWLAVLGVVSGLVGIIISVTAIWQAICFYRQSKSAETATISALEGIKAQTRTLAEISGQQLSGLTQIVRDQVQQPDRRSEAFLAVINQLLPAHVTRLLEPTISTRTPVGETIENHGIPNLPPKVDKDALRDAAATTYFAVYYYAAHANILAQTHLPREEDYQESNMPHRVVRNLIDVSASDFRVAQEALAAWEKTDHAYLSSHRLHSTFGMEARQLASLIKNSRQRFDEMKTQQQPPA